MISSQIFELNLKSTNQSYCPPVIECVRVWYMILYYQQTEVPSADHIKQKYWIVWIFSEYITRYQYHTISLHAVISPAWHRCYNAQCYMMVRSLLIKGDVIWVLCVTNLKSIFSSLWQNLIRWSCCLSIIIEIRYFRIFYLKKSKSNEVLQST